MYAFGSSVTDHFDPVNSDMNLLVDLTIEDPLDYGDASLSLWDELEVVFNLKVDLLNPIPSRTVTWGRALNQQKN